MIATTRGSVASRSQSISFFSNGSMAMATFGFFHGSLNSGDWARVVREEKENSKQNMVSAFFILFDARLSLAQVHRCLKTIFDLVQLNCSQLAYKLRELSAIQCCYLMTEVDTLSRKPRSSASQWHRGRTASRLCSRTGERNHNY